MYTYLVVVALAVFATTNTVFAEDPPPTIVWNKILDAGSNEYAEDIAVDADGFVYVTGNYWNGNDWDWLTVRYNADGDTIWTRLFDASVDDVASAVAADTRNVCVVGWVEDWRVIKYDADGNILWNQAHDWPGGQGAHSVAMDPGGFIYVTGDIHNGGDWDYLTIKYNSDGDTIWERTWDSGVDENAWAIAVDQAGYVYVSGNVTNVANVDWFTIKYDANGDTVWTRTYDSGNPDYMACDALTVDNAGNVYVAGWAENVTTDWQIIKYDASGTLVWDKTIDSGHDEGAWGLSTDTAGFLYVSGDIFNGLDWDYRTMKYDTDSNVMLWDVIYDSGYNEGGRGGAVDDSEFVYITGYSDNGTTADYRTIKYEQQTGVAEYSPVDCSPLTLEIVSNPTSSPTLRYMLPAGMHGSLSFYCADGRKIEEFSLSSSHATFTWDAGELPSGVYFVRLVFGDHSVSDKICLLK